MYRTHLECFHMNNRFYRYLNRFGQIRAIRSCCSNCRLSFSHSQYSPVFINRSHFLIATFPRQKIETRVLRYGFRFELYRLCFHHSKFFRQIGYLNRLCERKFFNYTNGYGSRYPVSISNSRFCRNNRCSDSYRRHLTVSIYRSYLFVT